MWISTWGSRTDENGAPERWADIVAVPDASSRPEKVKIRHCKHNYDHEWLVSLLGSMVSKHMNGTSRPVSWLQEETLLKPPLLVYRQNRAIPTEDIQLRGTSTVHSSGRRQLNCSFQSEIALWHHNRTSDKLGCRKTDWARFAAGHQGTEAQVMVSEDCCFGG